MIFLKAMKRVLACILSATILFSVFPAHTLTGLAAEGQPFQDSSPISAYQSGRQASDLRLWYDKATTVSKPGEAGMNGNDWQMRALPIGNGKMGAMLAGQVVDEYIQYNEDSLWDGGPSTSRPNYIGGNLPDKAALLDEVQELMLAGNTASASSKAGGLIGANQYSEGFGGYRNFGWIELSHKFDGTAFDASKLTNYMRDLDLNTATASTSFVYKDVGYARESFMSYPNNIMVTKHTATQAGSLTMDVSASASRGGTVTAVGNTITTQGALSDNQLKFESQIKVLHTGGTISANGDTISIIGADEVVLIMSAATDYENTYPHYRSGIDPHVPVTAALSAVENMSYDDLFSQHFDDYSEIFHRVSLDLNGTLSGKTTDVLLQEYKQNKPSRELEILLFQYGRYMGIASSRKGSLPANLQGVWNHSDSPAWDSDYHTNVNLQMNYWPTYVTNMSETAYPLIEYIDSWREPGRVTAEMYMGIVSDTTNPENGYTVNTINNPFGWTAPGWLFDWGWSPSSVPWILQNVWEYYEYTEDTEYLRDVIYPMMREQSVFWQQYLVLNPEDNMYYSAPAYSPEHGPRTLGNTYEHVLVKQLLVDTITAAEVLGVDEDLQVAWTDLSNRIRTEEIGADGQIKEWFDETTFGSMGGEGPHRHLSHLLGLYPGDSIGVNTPELLEAARVSLERRGNTSTGWGMGHRINTWARVQDGERAYLLMDHLFKNGIHENLFDTHPPFQIDGNFGYTSGVAEMLMQSNQGFIQPLPAIPSAWSRGSVSGLLARGNFEVGMDWSSKALDTMTILSKNGGECSVYYPNIADHVQVSQGGSEVSFTVVDANTITWDTQADEEFTLEITAAKATLVENVAVRSLSGAIKLGASNGSMHIVADITPVDADERTLTWKVTDLFDRITDLATIDQNGLLRGGTQSGKVRVTATSTDGSSVQGSMEIEISLGSIIQETIVDDSELTSDNYVGGWSEWFEAKHYGGSIHYVENIPASTGKAIEYSFEGTGIEVFTPLNDAFGSFEVYIDGDYQETVALYKDGIPSAGKPQQLVYSTRSLNRGTHTLKLVVAPRDGKSKVEFDFLKVIDEIYEQVDIIDNKDLTPAANYEGPWIEYSEPKHYGGSIHYVPQGDGLGAKILYDFYGTGIEVFTPLNATFGSLSVTIDGEYKETVELYRAGVPYEGTPQQQIYSLRDLPLGDHSLELEVVARDGKSKIEFDFLKVIDQSTIPNLVALQRALEEAEAILLDPSHSFTAASYQSFLSALADAVAGMNVPSQSDVDNVVANLNFSIDDLVEAQVDKSKLISVIGHVEALSRWDYNRDSWQSVIQAVTDGKATLENLGSTQEEIDHAATLIEAAIDQLIPTQPDVIDKSHLIALVALVESLTQGEYTPASWAGLEAPLSHAKQVVADSRATRGQVSGALETLRLAVDGLVLKTPDPRPDINKTALKALVAEGNTLKQATFTSESWIEFSRALTHATGIIAKTDATQLQVDAAAITLQAGIDGLVKTSTTPPVTPPITPPVTPPTTPPTTVSRSSGSSSSGSSQQDVATTQVFASTQKLLEEIETMKEKGNLTDLRIKGVNGITIDTLRKLAKALEGTETPIRILLDRQAEGSVRSRIYVDPGKVSAIKDNGTILSLVEYDSAATAAAVALFKKLYNNEVSVVSHGQKGSFGMEVRIAIRPDLSALDTKQLALYSMNEKTGALTVIEGANPRIDGNGFLHYTTSNGGYLVIVDDAIQSK